MVKLPYWRLSGFYFFYFASLGVLVPYWALYLKSLGFSALQIGQLMAIVMATKIIAPNIWGWIADHSGRRMSIVRVGALCALVSFVGVFFGQSYWWLATVMLLFSFFWNAVLPQFEATTFSHLGQQARRYSSIRLWGSVGFILAVAALGPVLERTGAGILPTVVLVSFAGIWVASWLTPDVGVAHAHPHAPALRHVLRQPGVLALLVVCFLAQASHGPYYTFYTIYMEQNGYSRSLIGQLWALGVIAEVAVFMFMHRLLSSVGLRALLILSLILSALRWLAIGTLVDSLAAMVVAQLLHAATFGIYHATAIQMIHIYFSGRHQGKGQALYSSLSFGAGGAVGSLYSGMSWDTLGPQATYLIAMGVSALSVLVAWRYLKVSDEGHGAP